jgi:hypothetical protein
MPGGQKSGSESNLKRQVMRMLKLESPHALARKRHNTAYSTNGDADLEILCCGVHIECELKRPGQKPTLIQTHRLEEWRAAGAKVFVVRSVAEARAMMREAVPDLAAAGSV